MTWRHDMDWSAMKAAVKRAVGPCGTEDDVLQMIGEVYAEAHALCGTPEEWEAKYGATEAQR